MTDKGTAWFLLAARRCRAGNVAGRFLGRVGEQGERGEQQTQSRADVPRHSKGPGRLSSVPHRLHNSRLINGSIGGRRVIAKLAHQQNSPPLPPCRSSALGAGRAGLTSTIVGLRLSWL